MAPAQLQVAAFTLVLGLGPCAGFARAEADAPQVGATPWRSERSSISHPVLVQSASSSNVYVDPRTGDEVYLPTGESIDEVVTVVAERVPAVASVDTGSTPASGPRSLPWTLLVAVPVALLLALSGQKLWRGRRGRSPVACAGRRITRRLAPQGAGL
jgi:hypothetical protein